MELRLRWTGPARKDLTDIYRYIREERPAAAAKMTAGLRRGALGLREFPGKGRSGSADDTRELVIPPYIIAYRVNAEFIEILRVLHEARNWPEGF